MIQKGRRYKQTTEDRSQVSLMASAAQQVEVLSMIFKTQDDDIIFYAPKS
jgi:hypothetical protein